MATIARPRRAAIPPPHVNAYDSDLDDASSVGYDDMGLDEEPVAPAAAAAPAPAASASASTTKVVDAHVGFLHPSFRLAVTSLQKDDRTIVVDGLRGRGDDILVESVRQEGVVPHWMHFTSYANLYVTLSDANATFVVGDVSYGGGDAMVQKIFTSGFVSQPQLDDSGFVHYVNSVDPHRQLNTNNCAVLGWFMHSMSNSARFAVGVRCGHQVDEATALEETTRLETTRAAERGLALSVAPIFELTRASYACSATEKSATYVRYDPLVRAPVPAVVFREDEVGVAASPAAKKPPGSAVPESSDVEATRKPPSAAQVRMRGTFGSERSSNGKASHTVEAHVDTFSFVATPGMEVPYAETPKLMGKSGVHRHSSVFASRAVPSNDNASDSLRIVYQDHCEMTVTKCDASSRPTIAHGSFQFHPFAPNSNLYAVKPTLITENDHKRWSRIEITTKADRYEIYDTSVPELTQTYERLRRFYEEDTSGLAAAALQHAGEMKAYPYVLKPNVRTLTSVEEQVLAAQEYDCPATHPAMAFMRHRASASASASPTFVRVAFMDFQRACEERRAHLRRGKLTAQSRSLSKLCVHAQPIDPRHASKPWTLSMWIGVWYAPLDLNGLDPWALDATSDKQRTLFPLTGHCFTPEQVECLKFTDIDHVA